jgi:hydrogenase expression/formation protein HypC
MCLGVAGQIVEILGDRPDVARVNVAGKDREVGLALLDPPPPEPGDWVLIHLGYALQRLTEAEALDTMALLDDDEDSPEPTAAPPAGDFIPPWARNVPAAPVADEGPA